MTLATANFRAEIPTRSFVNARVVDYAVETDSFNKCVRRALSDCGAPGAEYEFKNPAHLAGLLYCLVVVPKEIWILPENHVVYTHLERAGILELFSIALRDSKFDLHPTYYLIHRLRNAVAHANFSIDESQAFTFWDRKSRDQPVNWKASISNANLMQFLSKLGQLSDKLRKSQQEG